MILKRTQCVYPDCEKMIIVLHKHTKLTIYCPDHRKIRQKESMKARQQIYTTRYQKKEAQKLQNKLKQERFVGGQGIWEVMYRVAL